MKIEKDTFSSLFIWEWAKHILNLNLTHQNTMGRFSHISFDESSSLKLNNVHNSLLKEIYQLNMKLKIN